MSLKLYNYINQRLQSYVNYKIIIIINKVWCNYMKNDSFLD